MERKEWDRKQWELALLSKNPVHTYQEFVEQVRQADEPFTPIDDLPNKDWFRA